MKEKLLEEKKNLEIEIKNKIEFEEKFKTWKLKKE
jgi:hypothetical protein